MSGSKRLVVAELVVAKRAGVAAGLGVAVISAIAFSGPVAAQSVKPGLWEMTMATRMVGEGIPDGAGSRTMKMNLCIKPEDAKASWQDMAKTMQPGEDGDCTVSDFKASGQTYSFTTRCKSGMSGRMTGKITPEAMHQTGDMVFAEGGSTMKMNINNTSKWMGATCPPGTPGAK
ncbi:MAG TPA: DUF3617 domain-containing protein [Pedomonas sp.]|uniref:DUF3617 domain-containing protein n=1 Tax=Pedomonas sp. TaxID=2976421 RepID=UPI002F405191